MKVLGISPLDRDSTVTLVEDGEIKYAAGEERFTRVKLQDGFPWKAMADACQATHTDPSEIDCVAYPFLDSTTETRLFQRNLDHEREFLTEEAFHTNGKVARARARVPERHEPVPGLGHPNERFEKGVLKSLAYRVLANESVVSRNVAKRGSHSWGKEAAAFHQKWQTELENGLDELGLGDKLVRVEHHSSHAANAYYTSGFDEALIVTLDGYGSGLAGSVSIGRNGRINRINCTEYPHSLGTFYETVTSALGFKPSRHEGKIVGLAAYGDPEVLRDVLLSRFQQTPGNFRIVESNNLFFARMLASQFPKIDVAAAYQHVLELVACAHVGYYLEKTKIRNLVLSGGVVANVKLNQRLRALPGVERIFIHQNMGDGGCGTGAALLQFAADGLAPRALDHVYLGPTFSNDQMAEALNRAQLPFSHYATVEPRIASLIASGKVVARFNGAMEYGPRALGNRSILYHAREPEVNQWLNQRLGRTEFMPFAPATLYEKRHDYYMGIDGADYTAEFMTLTCDCTDRMKRESPAAVHVDGTARPQLVTERANPSFYQVLREYHRLTGMASVINTSFNMHEEPIVCSPDDAIRAFLQGSLDYLAMGDFIAAHPSSQRP